MSARPHACSLLVGHGHERSLRRDRHQLWLTAWAGNSNALAFYKTLGYEDVGSTLYVIEGKGYENRVLCKRLAGGSA